MPKRNYITAFPSPPSPPRKRRYGSPRQSEEYLTLCRDLFPSIDETHTAEQALNDLKID